MNSPIIKDWKPEYAQGYGDEQLLLHHRLNETGLFTREALGKLIDKYPEKFCYLATMGYDPEIPQWREGRVGGKSGKDVIEAIERGRMWLNLLNLQDVDDEYRKVLDDIYDEFQSYMPNFETFKRRITILISSPLVQVFYHADIPGQSLWQLAGEKRVYVYPNTAPFLMQENLEGIFLGETEEEVPYKHEFDEHASIYDLKAGEMVHWPINCPHRVENKDCLNVSITTEHWTTNLRKHYAVNYANGVLRRKFGFNNLSQDTDSIAAYAKGALAVAWRQMKLSEKEKFVHMTDFEIDPTSETGIVDIEPVKKAS